MKRLGAPLRAPTMDATLMIEPCPLASLPGRKARARRYCERTLRLKAKSHSSSLLSRMVPAWTKPAPLNRTSTSPTSAASAAMAAPSVTSSRWVVQPHSACRLASAAVSMSVAITRAPWAAKARAVARPMPWPAAVRKAVLPESRWDMVGSFSEEGGGRGRSKHLAGVEQAARVQGLLDRAHQGDLLGAAGVAQPVALEGADAVLGRHRAAELAHQAVDDGVDRVLGLLGRARQVGDDVQVAVADVAVVEGVDARQRLGQRGTAALHVLLHARHRQADVVGQVAGPQRVELAAGAAQRPEGAGVGDGLRQRGVGHHARLQQAAQPGLEARAVLLGVGAQGLDQHVGTVRGRVVGEG